MMPQMPKMKYVPHKVLKEGFTYVALSDSDYVLAVKLVLTKVSRVLDANEKPMSNQDGTVVITFLRMGIVLRFS